MLYSRYLLEKTTYEYTKFVNVVWPILLKGKAHAVPSYWMTKLSTLLHLWTLAYLKIPLNWIEWEMGGEDGIWYKFEGFSSDFVELRLFSSVKEGKEKDTVSHEDRDTSWLPSTGPFFWSSETKRGFHYFFCLPYFISLINSSDLNLHLFLLLVYITFSYISHQSSCALAFRLQFYY